MTYTVKEIFKTLQGEGGQAGKAAVFCRFSGCNLWSGLERDRATAICRFCDTDFVGINGENGGKFASAEALAATIAHCWGNGTAHRLVVFTGGEPLLQLDEALITAIKQQGFSIAVESNGTITAPAGIDWLCISPKAGAKLVQKTGQELKLVYPQTGLEPEEFATLDFQHFFLQPMDNECRIDNTNQAVAYCLNNPPWRISLQTHKLMGIP
ncbi:MAG: 7-carboxy-7-deazaguanine synthase [Alphaproteobacteria bacterium]